jgi:hypothetical protein
LAAVAALVRGQTVTVAALVLVTALAMETVMVTAMGTEAALAV